MVLNVDQILGEVGGYHRWHLTIFTLISVIGYLSVCWQGLAIVFIGWTPPHHCQVPDGLEVNTTIPVLPDGSLDKCLMYENSSISNNTIPCTSGWTYLTEVDQTIVMEWDLVCGQNFLSDLSQVFYQSGSLLGMMVTGYIMDRFGRKKVFIISNIVVVILGVVTAYAPSYVVFTVLRPLTAIAVTGTFSPAFMYTMEIFDSKRRSLVGTAWQYSWVFLYMLLALLAYFIRNWRTYQLEVSLFSLTGIIFIWIMPESPFWLVIKGRTEEAKKVLIKMAHLNGRPVPTTLLNEGDNGDTKEAELKQFIDNKETNTQVVPKEKPKTMEETNLGTFIDLFKDPILRKYVIILSFLAFTDSLVYFTLTLGSANLAGNRFVNFLMSGVVELPAFGLAMVVVVRCGRRVPCFVLYFLSAVPLLLTALIPAKTASGTDLGPLHLTLSLCGKFGMTAVFAVMVLFMTELFPTNLRGRSDAVCHVLGKVGSMAAPSIVFSAKTHPWIPNVVMAALQFTAAVLVLLLPETRNVPLPENMADIYALHKKKSGLCPCVKQIEMHDQEETLEHS